MQPDSAAETESAWVIVFLEVNHFFDVCNFTNRIFISSMHYDVSSFILIIKSRAGNRGTKLNATWLSWNRKCLSNHIFGGKQALAVTYSLPCKTLIHLLTRSFSVTNKRNTLYFDSTSNFVSFFLETELVNRSRLQQQNIESDWNSSWNKKFFWFQQQNVSIAIWSGLTSTLKFRSYVRLMKSRDIISRNLDDTNGTQHKNIKLVWVEL